jgi:hypothetical protein
MGDRMAAFIGGPMEGTRTVLRIAVLGPVLLVVMAIAWLLKDHRGVEDMRRLIREGVRPTGDERSPG